MASPPYASVAAHRQIQLGLPTPSYSPSFDSIPQAELQFWRSLRMKRDKPRKHPSIYWCTPDDYIKERRVAIPSGLPYFDASSWSFVPEMDPTTMQWKKCHLLSLPEELRLEIWRHVLTDPSVSPVTVEITRAPRSPGKTSIRFPNPCVKTTIQPPRKFPININILATNHFIYKEALPVLYQSLQLAPLDLEGIFDPFVKTISTFAQSHIRYIKLRVPQAIYEPPLFSNPSTHLVNWAITCAQVAKIQDLREVEIEDYPLSSSSERVKNGILNPLCKIKAKKMFSADVEESAQKALAEAEIALQGQAHIRRQRTMSEAAERALRDAFEEQQKIREDEARKLREEEAWGRSYSLPVLPHPTIERDLIQIAGIRHFEQELQEHERSNSVFEDEPENEIDVATGEWELVSLKSGACTPKATAGNKYDKDCESDDESDLGSWTDTSSTLVEVPSRGL